MTTKAKSSVRSACALGAQQLDEPDQHLVVEVGDELDHVADRHAGGAQVQHPLLDVRVQRAQVVERAGVLDVEHELVRGVGLQAQDVGVGDDAGERAGLIDHHQAVDLQARHAVQRFVQHVVLADRGQRRVHDVAHRQLDR